MPHSSAGNCELACELDCELRCVSATDLPEGTSGGSPVPRVALPIRLRSARARLSLNLAMARRISSLFSNYSPLCDATMIQHASSCRMKCKNPREGCPSRGRLHHC